MLNLGQDEEQKLGHRRSRKPDYCEMMIRRFLWSENDDRLIVGGGVEDEM
jgi:hypothetical protein